MATTYQPESGTHSITDQHRRGCCSGCPHRLSDFISTHNFVEAGTRLDQGQSSTATKAKMKSLNGLNATAETVQIMDEEFWGGIRARKKSDPTSHFEETTAAEQDETHLFVANNTEPNRNKLDNNVPGCCRI